MTRATEVEMNTNQSEQGRTLRAFMGVGAALCVLGLASLVFLHAPDATTAMASTAASYDAATPMPLAGFGSTNVPSAEAVFRDKGYVAPEEPVAQF